MAEAGSGVSGVEFARSWREKENWKDNNLAVLLGAAGCCLVLLCHTRRCLRSELREFAKFDMKAAAASSSRAASPLTAHKLQL